MSPDGQQELEDRLWKETVTKTLQGSYAGDPWGQHQNNPKSK